MPTSYSVSFSGCTERKTTTEPAWAWPSSTGSCIGTADGYGQMPRRTRAQRSSSRSARPNPLNTDRSVGLLTQRSAREYPTMAPELPDSAAVNDKLVEILLIEDSPSDVQRS